MDQDGKITLSIIALIAACLIISAMTIYELRRDRMVAEMVRNGADPMLAACALHAAREPVCQAYIANNPDQQTGEKQ